MGLVVEFAYIRSVSVTEENVVELLAAADQFMVQDIVQTCCLFLEDQLCPENCIGIWRLVDIYYCPELRQKAFEFILDHFQEVFCVSEEFLELSVQQLADFIGNDRLNVKQEDTVCEAVFHWIQHLPEQRRSDISNLLLRVRLGLMTPHYFLNILVRNPVINDSKDCIPIINDAVVALFDYKRNRNLCDYSNTLTRPRLPYSMLLVTGGRNSILPANNFEVYDDRADRWVTMKSGGTDRAHHGSAVLNNFVYIIGGCNSFGHLNSVQKFSLVTRTSCFVTCMIFCRCYVSVAVLNGHIYAMGGLSEQTTLKSAERYDPETDHWTLLAPMHVKRSQASATALNGKVYICGGLHVRETLATAECYHPHANQWTVISPMINLRCGLGVAAYRNRIYAVGGFNGHFILRSVEAYDPQTNRWRTVPSMFKARSFFGIEIMDNQLFVVGGFNRFGPTVSVEHYDEEVGVWTSAADINIPRSGLSCCVLHGLHSLAENLFSRGTSKSHSTKEATGGPGVSTHK
ncbi:hypothetical protein LDENG_00052950 [Lucifuga dentata]|nr:hypothetical protein LDENG_00052950 [Lucifuga dentata]